jgi:alpha-beta hydrolase superfamily lysophospholipase
LTTEARPVTAVESLPLWIGSPDRPLFAWLDIPDDGLVAGAAVICPSMGLEAAYSSRALRSLAHQLAGNRWAALRLDYAATGDSVGSWTDPGLVAEWLGNIRLAVDWVRALGAARVGVVGLRLGALLAAAELARGGPVDDLVLWDPCATGRSFLREQTAFAAFRRQLAVEWGVEPKAKGRESRPTPADGSVEAPGAVFSGATAADLAPLAVAWSDHSPAPRELVLTREDRRIERAVAKRLTMPGVESSGITGQEALFGEQPVTPVPTLDRIVSWLVEPGGSPARLIVPERSASAVHRAPGRAGVRERPVELGPARLFGVLSEPENGVDPSAPTVVFLNVGVIGHQGPGRLWVELARACAAAGGVRCLRADLSGIGDSPARPGRAELVVRPVDAPEDMDDIRRAMTGEGAELIVIGVCSGADHAIESALSTPVAALCVVNPALSYWMRRGGDEEAATADGAPQASADRKTWGGPGPLLARAMALVAPYKRLSRWIPTPGWWVVKRWLTTGTMVGTLEHLAQHGVDVLVVAGPIEARRVYRGEQHRLHALIAKGGVHMEIVPDLDHSLLERISHDRMAELVGSYVARRAADLSGPGGAPAAP